MRMMVTAKSKGKLDKAVALFLGRLLKAASNSKQLDQLLNQIQEWFNTDALEQLEEMEQDELAKMQQ